MPGAKGLDRGGQQEDVWKGRSASAEGVVEARRKALSLEQKWLEPDIPG